MKRIIYFISLIFVTITMMAQSQTSFIVADKNGNSQLVQSLIFLQEQYGDRTSSGFRYIWKADKSTRGDIEDLGYIARTNSTLATGSVDEVTTMLEQISGSNQADAEAVAAMLTENENVEEAQSSSDCQSLIVKFKDENVVSVYPVNIPTDPFYEEDAYDLAREIGTQKNLSKAKEHRSSGKNGKVAVFNYFSNYLTRKTQNKMLEYMMLDLKNHDYKVEYYPYELMTIEKLRNVINASKSYESDYVAVIVISHGYAENKLDNKYAYFAIGEAYDEKNMDASYRLFLETGASENDKIPFVQKFWNEGFGAFGSGARYDCMVSVDKMNLNPDIILYMGSCGAYTHKNYHGTCIGWSGVNATAQAHVAVLFYNLLRGKTLADALDIKDDEYQYYDITRAQHDTWTDDVITYRASMKYQLLGRYMVSQYSPTPSLGTLPNYWRNAQWYLKDVKFNGPFFLKNKNIKINLTMEDKANQNPDLYPNKIFLKAIPLRPDASPKIYSTKKKGDDGSYKEVKISLPDNGVYFVRAYADEECNNEILMKKPFVFVRGEAFKENEGEPDDLTEFCPDDNHPHMIDLGLPSGIKWACCNIGATSPEEYGGYYSWGEVEEKDYYDYSTYIHCDGSESTIHDIGSDISGTEYDVAHIKWGGEWVMPKNWLIDELYEYCTLEETTLNEVTGLKFTGPNGRSIFLPACGYYLYSSIRLDGECEYWSSQLQTKVPTTAYYWGSNTVNKGRVTNSTSRWQGNTIRPVINTAK